MRFSRMSAMSAIHVALVTTGVLGGFSLQGRAGTIDPAVQVVVNAFNPDGTALTQLVPGDFVKFEVGVVVDESYIPPDQIGGTGNNGLTVLVYDVLSPEAIAKGYLLNPMQDAFSGFSNNGADVPTPGVGGPAVVSNDFFSSSNNSISASYGGGWGFNRAGSPGGGDATTLPGGIIAAGILPPFEWMADTNLNLSGFQPNIRQGVGIGAFTFPDEDPILGGVQGGFGFELGNTITPGDGTWIAQEGVIDTTGWDLQTYSFSIDSETAQVFNGTLDYSQNHFSGFFTSVVTVDQIGGTSFSFTLVPEPCATGALLVAGLALVRRQPSRLRYRYKNAHL